MQHNEIIDELFKVWSDCKIPNWDGYNALPVPKEAYDLACELVKALPVELPSPSVGAEPDGDLTLEWYKNQDRLISVSVSSDGRLYYASVLGNGRISGIINFPTEAPIELIRLINEV